MFENHLKCLIVTFSILAFSTKFCPFEIDLEFLLYLVTLLLLASLAMLNETFSVILKYSEYVILPLSHTTCMYSHPIEYETY